MAGSDSQAMRFLRSGILLLPKLLFQFPDSCFGSVALLLGGNAAAFGNVNRFIVTGQVELRYLVEPEQAAAFPTQFQVQRRAIPPVIAVVRPVNGERLIAAFHQPVAARAAPGNDGLR